MKKIKIGIIGCGCIARDAHIPAFISHADECEIKYFCDTSLEKAKKCAEDFGCGTAVSDWRSVLTDKDVDAVSICVPNFMHREISVAAMRAGKHVLCEKPAAACYAEALEMQRVQHETGLVLNIGVVTRFHESVEKVRALVASGALGDVYHVFVSFRSFRCIPGIGGQFTTKALSGGGVLIDWGVHRIDQVMYLVGDPEPLRVSAATFGCLGRDIPNYHYRKMWSEETRNPGGTYDVEESCTALLRTSGPVITLMGAWAQNIDEDEQFIDIMGTKGGVRLTYCGGYKLYTEKDGEFVTETFEPGDSNMFEAEIADFLRCVRSGERSRAGIDSAVKTSLILQGAYDSAEAGREVSLADYPRL